MLSVQRRRVNSTVRRHSGGETIRRWIENEIRKVFSADLHRNPQCADGKPRTLPPVKGQPLLSHSN